MATCLVTGGAGFIGCALSSGLAERFTRVLVLDSLHPQVHAQQVRPDRLDERVEFQHADVTDPGVWDQVIPTLRPDIIIHLAAETGTGQSLRESTRHAHVNVVGTTSMLDGLSRHGHAPKQIVLSSSRAVYGEGAWRRADGSVYYPGSRSLQQLERQHWDFLGATHIPFAAQVIHPRPSNVYAATKLAQEHLLEAWCSAFGARLTVLRLQNVYGPGQSLTNSYTGIVSLFAQMARDGRSIPLYEDGEMLRDFVYIEDVAAAFLAAIDAPPAEAARLDIGTGGANTLAQAAHILTRRYGAPAPHVSGAYRLGDVRHASCNIEPTKSALPWQPQWPLERGLESLCLWIDQELAR